jgi:predicted nucleic acid-binding Zn ribbon protein
VGNRVDEGDNKGSGISVFRRGWPGAIQFVIAAAAMSALLGDVAGAFARAGGGEGYGGGGDDGGGGGGGGGGGIGWLIYFWIRFCFEYPYVGLPITVVALVVVYHGHKQGLAAYQGGVIRRGGDAADENRIGEAAAAMAAADPKFNLQQMGQRIHMAFMKIQDAWCKQDLSSVRPFISDGVHERFSLQIEEQKAFGYQDRMEGIAIASIVLVEFYEGNIFDVATVRIEAQAADYRVSLSDGKRLSGSTAVQPFVEVWSWLRRHGVSRDPSKPGLIEGHCPNCGAAVEMNQSAKCDHCGALLRSGEFDWVLTEITQQSEWRRGRHGQAPGVEEMQKVDPGFNRADLEDRASVMFWRKAMADRIGKIDPLRKIASEEFTSAYAQSLGLQPDGSRALFTDCSVGGANLAGVFSDDQTQSAIVEVGWEGERSIAMPGHPIKPTGQRVQTHTLYLLKRKAGIQSDPGTSVSSAHCPNCGAPITSDISSACSFCNTVLNDGTRGWVLSEIASASSSDGQTWIMRLRSIDTQVRAPGRPNGRINISPSGLLAWSVKVAAADGEVDPAERKLLLSLADKCGVEPMRVDQMIEMALGGRLEVPDPPDKLTAHLWLTAMAAAAMADGRLRPPEAQLLNTAAQRFGFGRQDVALLLRQQYAQRLAQARTELRTARGRQ